MFKTFFILLILIFLISLNDAFPNSESVQFLIDIEGFEAKPVEKNSIFLLGNITIEKRTYKNSKGKFKVQVYKGENLIENWKSLVFTFSGFSEDELEDLQIDEFKAKLYKKDNYKAIVLPLIETKNKALVIIFSSETFTLEELLDLIKKFPIKKYYLSSCPDN